MKLIKKVFLGLSLPAYLTLLTLSSIFIAEVVVILELKSTFISLSNNMMALVYALLLSFLISPILYFFLYKPMSKLKKLLEIKLQLEDKIQARTAELLNSNNLLKESEDRYRRLVEFSPDGIVVHSQGKIVFVNSSALKITGFPTAEDVLGKSVLEFVHPEYREIVEKRISQINVLEKGAPLIEEKFVGPNQTVVDVEVASSAFTYQGEKGVLVVFRDISERKRAEVIINRLAFHDTLTNLPNRRYLNESLSNLFIEAMTKKSNIAVLFIDLDELKNVNDTLGHAVGDEIIKNFSSRIQETNKGRGFLGRWGGDEFTLLISEVTREEISCIAQSIVDSFETPVILDNQQVYITPSIGIAVYPDDGTDPETIIKNADIAMYQAKESGGNNYEFFRSQMNDRIQRRMTIINLLRQAVNKEEFILHYQPIVRAVNQEIMGVEALIRWDNPKLGLMAPGEFIGLAEETGLIVEIGQWVLRDACTQMKFWQKNGLPPLYVAINLSARQFRMPNLVEMVSEVLAETGLDPCCLRLEITETTAMKDINFTIKTLERFKEMGINIAIDDFGTGHSSLNYLKRFPIHTIKIDRSFIKELPHNHEDVAIISAIMVLSASLNLEIIAEGVENVSQLEMLNLKGCMDYQGYLFSRPLPPKDFETLAAEKGQAFSEVAASFIKLS